MKKINPATTRQIYLWNMLGNLAASGSSVLYLIIITRLTDASISDIFSLVNGIAAIWVVIGLFQVRTFQGTDIQEEYSFSEYSFARLISIGLMWITILPYLILTNYNLADQESIWIMLLFLLYRTCDAISDLYQGLFQQKERLDLAGFGMTIRYALSVVGLLLSLLITKELIPSLFVLVVVNIICIFMLDIRYSVAFISRGNIKLDIARNVKKASSILKKCFPLFLSGFLLAVIFNEPKQAIAVGLNQGWLTEGAQRDYGILFMPAFFMSLFVLILRPLITQLAVYWNQGEDEKFHQVSRKLFQSLTIGGAAIVILAALIGSPILSVVFGVDLNKEWMTLTLIVMGGVVYSVAITLVDVMTIFRKQFLFIPVLILITILSKVITQYFVHEYHLLGAGMSYLIVMIVFMLGSLLIYLNYTKRKTK